VAIDHTRALGLALGPDANQNRNWERIDDALWRLTKTREVDILGNLSVAGIATLAGRVTCGDLTADIATVTEIDSTGPLDVAGLATLAGGLDVAGLATLTGGLHVDGLSVLVDGLRVDNPPVVLPPGSLAGAALALGAAVQTVGVSTPMTGQITLNATPQELNQLTMTTAEELGRWELILVSGTLRYAGAANSTAVTTTLELRRGPAVQQVRQFLFTSAAAIAPTIDVPFTLVRITQPPDLTYEWSVWGSATVTATGPTAQCLFAQVAALQLR
jgi:hypothetical protein